MSRQMQWEICNNDEWYEFLTRDETGKIIAQMVIDDESIMTVITTPTVSLIEFFPPKTNLFEVQSFIQTTLQDEQ